MNTKLEEKLIEYEKNNPVTNTQEFLHAVESILKEEESKDVNEKDIDLIDEAIDTILSLEGVDIEELERDADALADKILDDVRGNVPSDVKKQKKVRIKWIIPVAAVLSLIISATLIAYAMGYDVLSMTSQAVKQLKENIWYNSNDASIIKSNDNRKYKDVEEMISKESFQNLLWPSQTDELKYDGNIKVTDFGNEPEVRCNIKFNGETVNYSIKISYTDSFNGETSVKIGEYDVYLCDFEDKCQANMNYKNNMYTITTSEADTLETFIEMLEEK